MGSVHSQGGVDASWRKMKFRKWPTTNKEKAATTHSPVRTDDKKRHPKLDMLHILSQGQNLNRSYTTDEFGVDNLGQVLHMLPAYDGTPWGLEWLPPTRVPSRIADQFVAIACQEIFQVSIFRVAGFVLGQVDCHPLGGLLDRVCYIRDKLQALQVASDWKNIFIEVEEVSWNKSV
ncbi:MAG: hypothetical protein CL912_02920 [Deltaproteobacteria bacterium]|nr:hypothetical protein [Deltaproteobacteria bacterium]